MLLWAVIGLWLQTGLALGAMPPASEWVNWNAQGEPEIQLYFFWTGACPHCRQARPFVEALARQHPWLQVHSFQIDRDPAGRLRYQQMAAALGEEARSVPAFLACYPDPGPAGSPSRTTILRRLHRPGRTGTAELTLMPGPCHAFL